MFFSACPHLHVHLHSLWFYVTAGVKIRDHLWYKLAQSSYVFSNQKKKILHMEHMHGCLRWGEWRFSSQFSLQGLWYNLAIWHTQRPWLPKQTSPLHKTLPWKLDLPNTNINNTLTNPKPQEIGVPQGSILSVILFMIKINKITTCLPHQKSTDHYMLMTLLQF